MTVALHPVPAQQGLGRAVALAVLAMTSLQLAAALSRPLVADIGAPAVTWLRMAAAGTVLLLVTRPQLRAQRAQGLGNAGLFVVSGDEHRDSRAPRCAR